MTHISANNIYQIMAFRLFGAKPLVGPMLAFCEKDLKEPNLVKF